MDAVYPAGASALARGRRERRAVTRARRRTAPVTFAEIKEVDEESAESEVAGGGAERRRPDVLEERLGRQVSEARRHRALRELSPAPAAAAPRAASEPAAPRDTPAGPLGS